MVQRGFNLYLFRFIQTLKDCLDQLVVSTGSHEQQEMTDGQTQNVNSTGTLLKIQAMLDTTKVTSRSSYSQVHEEHIIILLGLVFGYNSKYMYIL